MSLGTNPHIDQFFFYDRYDEVIVGAPIYSSNRMREVGRVYIYENMGVSDACHGL